MGQPKGIDARRTPRRVFNRAVGILFGGDYSIQQALQLSEGGMLYSSAIKRQTGDHILVTIVLPNGNLVVRGEILYGKPAAGGVSQYGVRFDGVALHHKRMIRNYVSAKTQAEAEVENENRDWPEH